VTLIRPTALIALLAGVAVAVSACEPVSITSSSRGAPVTTPPTTRPLQRPTSPPSTSKPKPSLQPIPKPPKKTEKVGAAALLSDGDTGTKVRQLQHRLGQIGWYSGKITGSYDDATAGAVRGFQTKRELEPTGAVDQRTWNRLVKMTREPTSAELHNRLVAGPAILELGSSGDRVRNLQARLRQIGWYSGKISDFYGQATVRAVAGFQGRRAIPVTGEVDQRTWDRLVGMSRTPTSDEMNNVAPKPAKAPGLDPRCMTGRAICISKLTNTLVWVVDGKSQLRMDVRFGSYETPTREGAFVIGWKSREHVSSIYHTPMPYALFFSGGQAVHYSADFAERGYAGASHGCVNVRNLSGIQWLFGQVRAGDKVIVYR
jgi:peptidoglycan hydrolase-like protein with peptidoglycan-binding domain